MLSEKSMDGGVARPIGMVVFAPEWVLVSPCVSEKRTSTYVRCSLLSLSAIHAPGAAVSLTGGLIRVM